MEKGSQGAVKGGLKPKPESWQPKMKTSDSERLNEIHNRKDNSGKWCPDNW